MKGNERRRTNATFIFSEKEVSVQQSLPTSLPASQCKLEDAVFWYSLNPQIWMEDPGQNLYAFDNPAQHRDGATDEG